MGRSEREDEEKRRRLAEALRANLRRRKDQARERKAERPDGDKDEEGV